MDFFFKNLPEVFVDIWGLNVMVSEKFGQKPRIYIGSETERLRGIVSRVGIKS